MRTDARIFRAASPLGLGRCWLGGGGCWLCRQTQTQPVLSPPLSAQEGAPAPILLPPKHHAGQAGGKRMAEMLLGLQPLGDRLWPSALLGWVAGEVPAWALSFPGDQEIRGHTHPGETAIRKATSILPSPPTCGRRMSFLKGAAGGRAVRVRNPESRPTEGPAPPPPAAFQGVPLVWPPHHDRDCYLP